MVLKAGKIHRVDFISRRTHSSCAARITRHLAEISSPVPFSLVCAAQSCFRMARARAVLGIPQLTQIETVPPSDSKTITKHRFTNSCQGPAQLSRTFTGKVLEAAG